jgi:hypothetical protein
MKVRTGDQYKEMKREALELHGIEMEWATLFGIPTEGTGANGKAERTTGGFIYWLNTNASGNIFNYVTDSDSLWNGQDWLSGGEYWLDQQLEQIFRYGSQEKLALCGSTALLHINRLVKNSGSYEINRSTKAYGLNVREWVTPFGVINIMLHPLMTYEATTRNDMYVMEPRLIKYRYVDDTKFLRDRQPNDVDGMNDEYLTEAGYEWHHPLSMGLLRGFGSANTN